MREIPLGEVNLDDKKEAENIVLDESDDSDVLVEELNNKIIVQFSKGVDPKTVFAELGINVMNIDANSVELPIDSIENKDNIVNKASEKQNSWFWYFDKNDGNNVEDKNCKETINVDYCVTLSDQRYIDEAISKLRLDPRVEYVVPQYQR
ncbi:MAG: hypothetical protein HZC15_05475 [Candidatus Omnitrophica bacterium]|nr:hypothetical protein [Candidatus Omnitrophota bacterium]